MGEGRAGGREGRGERGERRRARGRKGERREGGNAQLGAQPWKAWKGALDSGVYPACCVSCPYLCIMLHGLERGSRLIIAVHYAAPSYGESGRAGERGERRRERGSKGERREGENAPLGAQPSRSGALPSRTHPPASPRLGSAASMPVPLFSRRPPPAFRTALFSGAPAEKSSFRGGLRRGGQSATAVRRRPGRTGAGPSSGCRR